MSQLGPCGMAGAAAPRCRTVPPLTSYTCLPPTTLFCASPRTSSSTLGSRILSPTAHCSGDRFPLWAFFGGCICNTSGRSTSESTSGGGLLTKHLHQHINCTHTRALFGFFFFFLSFQVGYRRTGKHSIGIGMERGFCLSGEGVPVTGPVHHLSPLFLRTSTTSNNTVFGGGKTFGFFQGDKKRNREGGWASLRFFFSTPSLWRNYVKGNRDGLLGTYFFCPCMREV